MRLRLCQLSAFVMLALVPAFPQSLDERAVRAAYVFNITKMVEWPPGNDRLIIGFFGARQTGEILRKMLEGKISQSKPIYFLQLPSDTELPKCSLVYFADSGIRNFTPQSESWKMLASSQSGNRIPLSGTGE